MMKKILSLVFLWMLMVPFGHAELSSLSHLFALGKTIQDLDGDGFGEKIVLSIIIPDNASGAELALASDIAARANLESLAQDFALVRRESEVENWDELPNPILIGSNLRWLRDLAKERKLDPAALGPDRGLVFVFARKNQRGIACLAGSDEALLKTGRAYFLRWPYFWEIWGRENGATYSSFESDLKKFLEQEQIVLQTTVIREALYEFPPSGTARGALKSLSFTSGEIKELAVQIFFTDEDDQKKASRALDLLQRQRPKGQRSGVLSYPACAQISFELWYGKKSLRAVLPRPGSSRRLLTPSFKERLRPADRPEGDFDLLSLLSKAGLYADRDQDGILDGLESSVIIPGNLNNKGVTQLASKLVLPTAGASFPIVYLDTEIEDAASLLAPVLVGSNKFVLDLVKSGKLKTPALENASCLVRIVPKAFQTSPALVFWAPDNQGLEKGLHYFSTTFPYFEDFKEGNPQLRSVGTDFDAFLKGEKGSAEAYFDRRLDQMAEELQDKNVESLAIRIVLPGENKPYQEAVRKSLEGRLKAGTLQVVAPSLNAAQTVFSVEKEFGWEGDDALGLLQEKLKTLPPNPGPIKISLGVSESPEVRQRLKKQIEQALAVHGLAGFEVEVLSAYKQGFFWLTEKVLPALKNKGVHHMVVKFAEESDPRNVLKRFYSAPNRWLQELYPSDEILARELMLPLDKIDFEIKLNAGPIYEALAFDEKNSLLFQQNFSPHTREIPFLSVLPEWGAAKITTGWLKMESGKEILCDNPLRTDLEKFWDFYQEEVLRPVYSYILKKTAAEPTFAKQPYFKRLLVELWASEPDYRLGLDEEIVSSLEAIHDEIYFDTLDFLRGITRFNSDDKPLPEDTSRSSAPGSVLPMIHGSTEGGKARVKVTFDDWPALTPEMEIRWKEIGFEEMTRKFSFPLLKVKNLKMPEFIYNGQEDRMETLSLEMEAEKETDYLILIDLMSTYRKLLEKGLIADPFSYPELKSLAIRLRCQGLEKEEILPVALPSRPDEKAMTSPIKPEQALVPTTEILSPQRCLDIVHRLGQYKTVRSSIGGRSFEGRSVPVLEIFLPIGKYVSAARLITFKPSLQVSSRQHANEVSSTNYALKLAELLAREKPYQDSLRKINFIIQPMENPDGAASALELFQLTPFHSLHAGRYGSLGVDIGYQMNAAAKPLLPEASVRADLYNKWLPDIYLNLHGYPSHEWVQPFSNYSPYLFQDYWIPRGWFTYYKALSLPIYEKWKAAGDELMSFIIQEIQADKRIKESNKKFYERFSRWAARWQPFLSPLELYEGVNIYAKRQSSQENRLSSRSQITFIEQTPELMDETATGPWLNFLCEQGLAHLRAHIKYLSQTKFDVSRLEEEVQDRIRFEFHRSRPGQTEKVR